ncbi:Serine/threonine-protein kinase pim-1 [Triplophysa tibetana]|uniref:non-specific serine/threonine protein kinase n=1 Tax=Triplophysa tibetana TaxID=1572043 RepID=A0A5A9PSU3_9TELE|nr:Serine/threonine-protein kinase pim-1 [Triplophysa tibetana]
MRVTAQSVMGQRFGKGVKTDGVGDRSGLYDQCTAAPSDIDHHSPVRFGKLREMHRRREEVISSQGLTLGDMEILKTPVIEGPDLAYSLDRLLYGLDSDSDSVQDPFKSKSVREEEIRRVQDHIESAVEEDSLQSSLSLLEEKLEDAETPSVNIQGQSQQQNTTNTYTIMVIGLSDSLDGLLVGLDLDSDAVQNPVPSKLVRDEEIQPVQAHIEAAVEEDIQQSSVRLSEEKLEDSGTPNVNMQEINSCKYAVGGILAASACRVVYAGTRVHDGLEVALKYVHTSRHLDYIRAPGHPDPLPREVALQMLACDDGRSPEIVQLSDWQEHPDHYIMVLERPSPCEGLNKFVASRGGKLDEKLAKRIMWQAYLAAKTCCEQGVFHRNITLENLLINTDTMDVKLIDFGCGELLKNSTYNTFTGTREYICPEFFKTGNYNGKQATVYSLGVLLFALLCGKFPSINDRFFINERAWNKDGLTEQCCCLVEDCLQDDPETRIDLERIYEDIWFQDNSLDDSQTPINSGSQDCSEEKLEDVNQSRVFGLEINGCQYEVGRELGKGGFGTVYEGTRVHDGLKVAVKYVEKTKNVIKDYIKIPGCSKPLPREVGLHLLARKGDNVPVIIQLLDWQDNPDQIIMVLERPSPCEDVRSFVKHNGGTVTEVIARTIFRQAAEAAQVCCKRGVFHRDIKKQNLLINPNTLEVKLIDFGCGDLLKSSTYKRYMGTRKYTCPEYAETGSYHGKPATVYSLGVLLFAMVCGNYPNSFELKQINDKKWSKDGLTAECCDFIQACLQRNPDERIHLEEILKHAWF